MLIPNNAHAMSKRSSGLDKYFVAKRKLVEDREGSNADSTENSTSSNELATDEASSSFDLEISDSDSDIAIEDQPQELGSELATNDRVSYS